MIKKRVYYLLIGLVVTANALAATQSADQNFYLRLDAGHSKAEKLNNDERVYRKFNPKKADIFGLGAGYNVSNHFRADITLSNRDYKLNNSDTVNGIAINDTQKISSTTLMLSGYYDIGTYRNFTPYLAVGTGIAMNRAGDLKIVHSFGNIIYPGKTNVNVAYQIGAGTTVKLTEKMDIDLNYKFINMGYIKTTSGIATDSSITVLSKAKAHLKSHECMIGIRFNL